jgi:uncharacterized membrane protein YdjX (TVP38/TMEM64 family)
VPAVSRFADRSPSSGEAASAARRPLWLRVGLWLLVGAALAGLIIGVLLSPVGSAAEFEDWLDGLGWWAPAVYICSMALLQPLGVPGLLFMVPAALVWPAGYAIGLSWIGNMIASTIAFVFARRYGRERLRPMIPERILRYEQRVIDRQYLSVTALRVFTGQLVGADWFLGLSKVRVRPFLVGTGIGIIPGILLAVFVGSGVVEAFVERPILTGALIVAAVVLWQVAKRRRSRQADQPS